MSDQSAEEIIEQIEAHIALGDDEWQMDNSDFEALIASWRERGEMLKECADDLEAELRDRYCFNGSSEPHPSLKRQFDRDMETVRRARAALKQAGEK